MNHTTSNTAHSFRRAITLTEVLIAMGILAIGLLGVASVFPVGGYYMQSGDIADRGGAIAHAALEDAIIRGHLNPENWVVQDASDLTVNYMKLTEGLDSDDPSKVRLGLRDASVGTVRLPRPVGPLQNLVETQSEVYRSTFFGSAFIIDPLGFAAALQNPPITLNYLPLAPIRNFPGFAMASDTAWYQSNRWAPWNGLNLNGFWPVRRVSTLGINGSANLQLARELFTAADDLALSLPDSGDLPSRQNWDTWRDTNGTYASARESRGDYSWLISVSPGSEEAVQSLATNPDAYPVEVSTVVFYKRVLPRERSVGIDVIADSERLVDARVVSRSPGGGELFLSKRAGDGGESPFDELRAGQYVMVTGPHPLSTPERPMLVLRWCRVLSIEDSGTPALRTSPPFQPTLDSEQSILVSLRGPDWPWEAEADMNQTNLIANDLKVAIVPGAVAVHTRTMRLEAGTEWGIK